MATSGSINWSLNRDQISTLALKLIGVVGAGETASSNDLSDCSSVLNDMVKAWQAQGIHLWKESEGILALTAGQAKYTISSSATDRAGDNAIETTLTADASSSATTLTVDSTTGMTASDVIGISLDADTIHWTTISSVDSSTGLTIASGLSSAASSGSLVLTFTNRVARPVDITSCRYKYNDGIERSMKRVGRNQYMSLPNKTIQAPATMWYFSPQLSNGLLYIYPTPDTTDDTIHFTYLKSIEDFDAASDDPDFPQEWLEALKYNLAVRIAPMYGRPLSKINPDIIVIAEKSLADLRAYDAEEGSVRIVPNYRNDE